MAQQKLIGDDIVVRELISHYLHLLGNHQLSDSLVPRLFDALNSLVQSSAEAKSHYLESQGEEITERWDNHKNEQI